MFENRKVRAGARQPEAAPVGSKPNTILNVIPMEQIAVRYVDAESNVRVTTLVKVGNQYYEPAGAVDWTENLAPIKDWMQKSLIAREESTSPDAIPSKDSVNVVA